MGYSMNLHIMRRYILTEEGDFMTFPGQIISLKRVVGIFIALISISLPLQGNDSNDTYIKLGEEFGKSGQDFLAYQNYISAYLLEDDHKKAVELGLKALSTCLSLNRINEGIWLIDSLFEKEGDFESGQRRFLGCEPRDDDAFRPAGRRRHDNHYG